MLRNRTARLLKTPHRAACCFPYLTGAKEPHAQMAQHPPTQTLSLRQIIHSKSPRTRPQEGSASSSTTKPLVCSGRRGRL